jgi:ABC-2 type transport system ATP-binding protein
MTFTQLDQLALKPIGGLSKGMKQRLCLSRALIHDPKVLVLDEPAAGLDPRARIELREMIRALASEGKTILVSSHILSELAEMCDRVAIIEQGQLLAIGSVDEILAERTSQPASDLQANQKTDRLSVTVISDAEAAFAWLQQRDGVASVTRELYTLRFECSVDPATQAKLLADMVGAGLAVVRFEGKQRSLEDVFLQVTEGRVQ